MKLHYIAALVLFIFAGLSLYQGVQDGEMEQPTWVIAFLVFAPIALFYEKLRRWIMPRVTVFPKKLFVALMLIFVGCMLIRGVIIGDNQEVVGWSSSLIVGCVYLLVQGKEKLRPWLNAITFIAMGVLLVFGLFYFFVVETKKEALPKLGGESQRPSVSPKSVRPGNDSLHIDVQKKVTNILTSEEVKQEIRNAAEAGSSPEFLKSFSKFKDYMISKGITEFSMADQSPSHFQDLFQKHYPGKTPSDLEPEMRQRLIDMIEEYGYDKGRKKFLQTREVGIWAAARFKLLSDNQESITAWVDDVYISDLEDTENIIGSVSPPPIVSQDALSSDNSVLAPPFTETENVSSAQVQPLTEVSTRGGPGKVITEKLPTAPERPIDLELEARLKKQFSSARFERAMDTLERYGPKEGLRRLRENDPEVAKQIENSRRAGGERHRNRKEVSK